MGYSPKGHRESDMTEHALPYCLIRWPACPQDQPMPTEPVVNFFVQHGFLGVQRSSIWETPLNGKEQLGKKERQ